RLHDPADRQRRRAGRVRRDHGAVAARDRRRVSVPAANVHRQRVAGTSECARLFRALDVRQVPVTGWRATEPAAIEALAAAPGGAGGRCGGVGAAAGPPGRVASIAGATRGGRRAVARFLIAMGAPATATLDLEVDDAEALAAAIGGDALDWQGGGVHVRFPK